MQKITLKQWQDTHADYKTIISGVHHICEYDDTLGTVLKPVQVIDPSKPTPTIISVQIDKTGYIVESSGNQSKKWLVTGKLKDALNDALVNAITEGEELNKETK